MIFGGYYEKMRLLIILFLFFISDLTFGQTRIIHVNLRNDNDTSLWYKWRGELAQELKLKKIQSTTNKFYFRLWTDKQVIDIWITNDKKYHGEITSWVKEYVSYSKEEQTNRIFFKVNQMDSVQVFNTIRLIDSTKIQNIPDESLIKNWQQGFDGITYNIETSDSLDYYFKTYWTPTSQDSVKEAVIVQTFVDRVITTSEVSNLWSRFAMEIPFECYVNNGPMCTCKILTNDQKRKYKRERKNYRQAAFK